MKKPNAEAMEARVRELIETGKSKGVLTYKEIVEMLGDLPEEKAAAPVVVDPKAAKGKDGAAADFVQAMNSAEHPEAGSPAAKTEEQARADRRKNAAMAAGRLRAVE